MAFRFHTAVAVALLLASVNLPGVHTLDEPRPVTPKSTSREAPRQANGPGPTLGKDDVLSHDFLNYGTLAGTLQPLYQSFLISRAEASALWNTIRRTVHWQDLVLLMSVGWLTVPIVQVHYVVLSRAWRKKKGLPFRRSMWFLLSDHLQQVIQIAVAVYIVDIVRLVGMAAGIQACRMTHFPHASAQLAYTFWGANRIAALLRHGMRSYVSRYPSAYGRARILQRLVVAVVYSLTALVAVSILHLHLGVAAKSILALGSVGSLTIGLASQGIAKEILNGLLIASSDRLYEGDTVKFGNGVTGTIEQLGWMETLLRGSDETVMSVPHSDLVRQRVSNLSRVRGSQVKQVVKVRIPDKDGASIWRLLARIRNEIETSCPKLITDGSRPFRVNWTSMDGDRHEITIDTRHRIPPTSDEYWSNREVVLFAIQRAIREHITQTPT